MPVKVMLSSSDAGTDVVVQPQITAARVDICIVRQELLERDSRSIVNRPTAVTTNNLVVLFAVAHDARHLGLIGTGSRFG
jgi:hypothetical protein